MATPILHYVYDPLCGWCYAAEPLVEAAAAAGVPIVLHGGGLWAPAVHATNAKRRSMRETDARIGQLTGQLPTIMNIARKPLSALADLQHDLVGLSSSATIRIAPAVQPDIALTFESYTGSS